MSRTTTTTTTARATGAWYLGLAITGMIGFLLVRPAVWIDGDPSATVTHLTERASLAHLSVALEMSIVLTQALAAHLVLQALPIRERVAGVAVAAFGLVNAVAIMASAVFMATALAKVCQPLTRARRRHCRHRRSAPPAQHRQLGHRRPVLRALADPDGWAAITSGRFPTTLGWLLAGRRGRLRAQQLRRLRPRQRDPTCSSTRWPSPPPSPNSG